MNELKIGILGCGHISKTHVQAWQRAGGCRVDGLFDTNRSQAEALAGRYRIAQVHEHVESLLDSSDVVDICTPPQTHGALLARALGRDRHVLVEKPIVVDLAEWETLEPLVLESKGKLAVVHNLKFIPAVQRAKRWIEARQIGRILRIQGQFLTNPETDRMLAGGDHWSHHLPGGRWFETLPHNLYLIHHLAGPLELDSATALSTSNAPPGAPADEVCVILSNEATIATIHFSASCRLNRRSVSIVGTDGMIELDLLDGTSTLSRSRDARWNRLVGRSLIDRSKALFSSTVRRPGYLAGRLVGATPHALLIERFMRHLEGSGPEPVPLAEIDYVVRFSDRIGRAIDRNLANRTGGK